MEHVRVPAQSPQSPSAIMPNVQAPRVSSSDLVERLTSSWVPFAGLTLVALVMRLIDLGARAMHHDESLHALYAWYLFVGRGYTHDPMMHGPFLFHFTALLYALFGDSEVTARLPLVLLGSASVFMPWFLRHELGYRGAIAASLMLAFGPVFLYFSRFGHNEALLMFQTLLVVVGVFGWIRTRRPVYLYAAAVGFGLMLATKVVFYIVAFIVVTFVGLTLAIERLRPFEYSILGILRDVGWRRWAICSVLVLGVAATLYSTFFTHLEGLCTAVLAPPFGPCAGKVGMLQYWETQQGVARGSQPWFYYFLLLPLYEIIPVTLALAAPLLARRPRTLFFWFCLWWSVFTISIYTYAGEKMPWLVVHLALPLVFLGALGADPVLSRLRGPWGLTPRQWAVAGLTFFAFAGLVAWATIGGDGTGGLAEQSGRLRRIALAIVVAAIVAGAVRVSGQLSRAQVFGSIAATLMAVLVAYSIHTGLQATYRNGDIPVELIVYVQSSPDVPHILDEIESMGNRTGLRRDLPILLDGGYVDDVGGQRVEHEAVSWPFEWYLRDYKGKQYYTRTLPADFTSGRYAAILVMGTSLDPIRDQLGNYTGNKFKLNWWYPEDYKQMSRENFFESLSTIAQTVWYTVSNADARTKLVKYIVYRELVNPVQGSSTSPALGGRELYFYVRNDLARGSAVAAADGAAPTLPSTSPAQVPQQQAAVAGVTILGRPPGGAPLLKEPKGMAADPEGRTYVTDAGNNNVTVFNRDGTVARQWGRGGSGDGDFNQPWGVAVAPDGSVFVADTWNHRVQKFDGQGRFLLKWGAGDIGTGPGQFYGPRDIAITPTGELLVTDTGNKRIQVFDQRGTFVRSFGTEGSAPGQFREPVGVTIDRQGRIYVADTWNQRVQVFDAAFQFLGQHAIQGWSSQSLVNKPYIAVGPEGEIYVTVPERGSIMRIKDGLVAQLSLPAQPRLANPTGIEVDGGGRLMVTATDAQSGMAVVYELDSGGSSD